MGDFVAASAEPPREPAKGGDDGGCTAPGSAARWSSSEATSSIVVPLRPSAAGSAVGRAQPWPNCPGA